MALALIVCAALAVVQPASAAGAMGGGGHGGGAAGGSAGGGMGGSAAGGMGGGGVGGMGGGAAGGAGGGHGFGAGRGKSLRIPGRRPGLNGFTFAERHFRETNTGFGYNGGAFGQGAYLPYNSARCLARVDGPDGPRVVRVC